MEKNKELILEVWDKAKKKSKEKNEELNKKNNVESVDVDEFYITYKFKDTGIKFKVPNYETEDYELKNTWDLSGKALDFAKEYRKINCEIYDEAIKDMKDKGFIEMDVDGAMMWWEKDGYEYVFLIFVEDSDDIEVEKL